MINYNFKPLVTSISVSRTARKINEKSAKIISKTASDVEYGKVISYKDRKKYGDYRRIK